jgi:putative transposase
MCDVLEVSTSGYHDWRSRPASATAERREELGGHVRRVFDVSHEAYGYRRVHARLLREGIEAGPEPVRALMRELGLEPCRPKPRPVTTIRDPQAMGTPDLVGRVFDDLVPGRTLVGDITYIATWEGFAYLATVLDCCTRMVLGHAVADHVRADLVIDALRMAARNHGLDPAAVFHSDRGSQYTSKDFRDELRRLGIRPSAGRTRGCWDNAMAESFNGVLKNELAYRTTYATRTIAERDIARYVELFHNRQRLHSTLGYRTPFEVYPEHTSKLTLAA